jgi:hypothetical protein
MRTHSMHNVTPGGARIVWDHREGKTTMYACKSGFHKVVTALGQTCVLCHRRIKVERRHMYVL